MPIQVTPDVRWAQLDHGPLGTFAIVTMQNQNQLVVFGHHAPEDRPTSIILSPPGQGRFAIRFLQQRSMVLLPPAASIICSTEVASFRPSMHYEEDIAGAIVIDNDGPAAIALNIHEMDGRLYYSLRNDRITYDRPRGQFSVTKWRIVLGDGDEQVVLAEVDVTPQPRPQAPR